MTSRSERADGVALRRYERRDSVVFMRAKDEWGGLSNMAAGYPVSVSGIRIRTIEALYQACRYTHAPDFQLEIVQATSPMAAKMVSRSHQNASRSDWSQVRVKVMRWCLRVKLAQNFGRFSTLLMSTEDHPVVEESHRDAFWGAKPHGASMLVGMNVLGRLLMELRDDLSTGRFSAHQVVQPPEVPSLMLGASEVEPVKVQEMEDCPEPAVTQGTLFE